MQFISILLFLFVYGATSVQFASAIDDFQPLPFQEQVEEVFDAFRKGDSIRMENAFKILEKIDPDKLNTLDDSNFPTNYTERINYVVSLSALYLTNFRKSRIFSSIWKIKCFLFIQVQPHQIGRLSC